MIDLYLRADTEADLAAACPWLRDGDEGWLSGGPGFAFDPIGPVDDDDRFHAMLRCDHDLAELVPAANIYTPEIPPRAWSGEPPGPSFEDLRAAKLTALAERRWQAETGGTTVAGVPIRTDATSQAKITGADLLFERDPTLTEVDWEAQPGVWVTVDRPTMTAIGIAVGRHVQACFSNAKGLSQAILAAEDASALEAIDIEAGWPA